jgi:hypothetical protein
VLFAQVGELRLVWLPLHPPLLPPVVQAIGLSCRLCWLLMLVWIIPVAGLPCILRPIEVRVCEWAVMAFRGEGSLQRCAKTWLHLHSPALLVLC